MITGIDLVFLPVRDLQRAIVFYRDKLQLPLEYQSKVWAEFFLGGQTKLALWLRDDITPAQGNIFLAVENIAKTSDTLKKIGIPIVFGPQHYFYGDVLEIKDTEENIIGLYQRCPRENH
jgi:predicted enzyme related to lactoylglutathione lyase